MTIDEKFRIWLRLRRNALGLTQAELAQRCGTTASNISAIERGHRIASYKMKQEISAQLAAKPSEILWRHKDSILKLAEKYQITDVRVFGSIARGEDNIFSDVDLLVTLPRRRWSAWDDFKREAQGVLGTKVDVMSNHNNANINPVLATAQKESIAL